jgi:hypothetical protein
MAATGVAMTALVLGVTGCTKSSSPSTATSGSTDTGTASGTPSPTGSTSGSTSGSTGASPTRTVPAFTDDAGKTLPRPDSTGGAVVTSNGTKAQVLVHPDSIVGGAAADLGKGASTGGRTPVYVTVTYTNAGTTTLQFPSLGTGLLATDSSGSPAQAFVSTTPVAKCPTHDSPESFSPGATFTDCQIFLVGKGTYLKTLGYRPSTRASQITWTLPKQ